MPLSDHFPQDLLRQQLTPGRVLHLFCPFAEKNKFVILAHVHHDPLVFVINSEIHPFIESKPHLRQCQVPIDQYSHPFLVRDSVVACHEVKSLDLQNIHDQIRSNPDSIKDPISDELQENIIEALKAAPTIPPADKNKILASFNYPPI